MDKTNTILDKYSIDNEMKWNGWTGARYTRLNELNCTGNRENLYSELNVAWLPSKYPIYFLGLLYMWMLHFHFRKLHTIEKKKWTKKPKRYQNETWSIWPGKLKIVPVETDGLAQWICKNALPTLSRIVDLHFYFWIPLTLKYMCAVKLFYSSLITSLEFALVTVVSSMEWLFS